MFSPKVHITKYHARIRLCSLAKRGQFDSRGGHYKRCTNIRNGLCVCVTKDVRNANIAVEFALISFLPTHGLTHRSLCQPKHSCSCVKSVPLQAQEVLKSVPKIPSMADLHSVGEPAHFFVTLSTAQDCS